MAKSLEPWLDAPLVQDVSAKHHVMPAAPVDVGGGIPPIPGVPDFIDSGEIFAELDAKKPPQDIFANAPIVANDEEARKLSELAGWDWKENQHGPVSFQLEGISQAEQAAYEGGEGWGEAIADRFPIVGSYKVFSNLGSVHSAVQRLKEGRASTVDQRLIGEFQGLSRRFEDKGVIGKAGEVISQLPAFMVELGLTGGSYTAARKFVGEALGEMAERGVKKGLSTVVGQGLTKGTARTLGIAAQTASNPQLIAKNAAQRRLEESLTNPESDGGSLISNLPAAFLDTAIEIGSEKAGGFVLDKLGLKGAGAALAKKWFGENLRPTPRMIAQAAKAANWDGVAGEVVEERLGEIARYATGLEEGAGMTGDLLAGNFDKVAEQAAIEAIAFSALPAGSMAANQAVMPGAEALADIIKQQVETRRQAREADPNRKAYGPLLAQERQEIAAAALQQFQAPQVGVEQPVDQESSFTPTGQPLGGVAENLADLESEPDENSPPPLSRIDRLKLQSLGYTPEDVDRMAPGEGQIIIDERKPKPYTAEQLRTIGEKGDELSPQTEQESEPAPELGLTGEQQPEAVPRQPQETVAQDPMDSIEIRAKQIAEMQAKLKDRTMRFAADRKDEVAEAIGLKGEQLDLPYDQWSAVDKAFTAGDIEGARKLADNFIGQVDTPDQGNAEPHEFSSTQVNLPEDISGKMIAASRKIADADLAEDGREDKPHVTVKFGLHDDAPDAVRKLIENEPPIKVKFGKTSIFETPEYDVVKVEVESQDLHRLNKKIAESLPNTETHPTYQPHATLAYVKKGEGKKYIGMTDLEGTETTLQSIAFSDKERKHTEIPLLGKPADAKPVEQPIETKNEDPADDMARLIEVKNKAALRQARERVSNLKTIKDVERELKQVPYANDAAYDSGQADSIRKAEANETALRERLKELQEAESAKPDPKTIGKKKTLSEPELRDRAVKEAKLYYGDDVKLVESQTDNERDALKLIESLGLVGALVENTNDDAASGFGGLHVPGESLGKDTLLIKSEAAWKEKGATSPGDNLWYILAHELAHGTALDKELSEHFTPKQKAAALAAYKAKNNNAKYAEMLEADPALADREAVAELMAEVFMSGRLQEEFKSNPSLLDKVLDFISKLMDKLTFQGKDAQVVLDKLKAIQAEVAADQAESTNGQPKEESSDVPPESHADVTPDLAKLTKAERTAYLEWKMGIGERPAFLDRPAEAPKPKSIGKKRPKKIGGKKPVDTEPKSVGKKTIQETAAEKRQKFRDSLKKFGQDVKLTSGLDPERARQAVQLIVEAVDAGIYTFAELVVEAYDMLGKARAIAIGPDLERAWGFYREANPSEEMSPVGNTADLVEELENDAANGPEQAEDGGQGDRTGRDGRDEFTDEGDDGVLAGESPGDVQVPPGERDADGSGDGIGDAIYRPDSQGDQPGDESGRSEPGVPGGTADGAGGGRKRTGRGNYHLTDPDRIVGGSQKVKFARNKKAIEIAQEIQTTGREPTQEELDTLASYVGWGAFGQELFKGTWEHSDPKNGWEDEDEWLRDTLGQKEWESVQTSIINAHYTDPETVHAMWDIARRLGFRGGRVLEPSMGIGNFYSMMPRDLMEKSQLTGIELDSVSGGIAKILHPDANIQIKGYEQSETPDDFYDLAITNVPFANYRPADRRYEKFRASIHNYFFLKAIDQVKPGGLVMFLTSNTTMDGIASASRVRRYIEERGDLVAAYRFPTGAFQRYAGTKVVADLIIVRKRLPGEVSKSEPWKEIVEAPTPHGTPVKVNEYWVANPENILGTLNFGHGTTSGRPGMIVDKPDNLEELLEGAVDRVPENILNAKQSTGKTLSNDTKNRQSTIVFRDDEPYIVQGEHLVPLQDVVSWTQARFKPETKRAKAMEIKSLVAVRDALSGVFDAQRVSDDAIDARKALDKAYNEHVAKYGFISDSNTASIFIKAGDPLGNALQALESLNPDGTYSKRPIFTRSTTRVKKNTENLTIGDAYAMQRNESLDLDIDRIAQLAKKTPSQVISELIEKNKIFKTATETWEAADQFLAGNVRRKFRETNAAIAEGVADLERSRDALEKVIPEDVSYLDISANLGATWVTPEDYKEFIGTLTGAEDALVIRRSGSWRIDPDARSFQSDSAATWHHPRVTFQKTIEAAMNNTSLSIYYKDDDGNSHFDEDETKNANERVEAIREEFRSWLWSTQGRIDRLAEAFNEAVNAYATPSYDGSHLSFEGLALEFGDSEFSFRKHQADAVWRGMLTGKGIYAHEVGTGKTFTMAGLAIESRRLGLAKKPVLFAHNANSTSVYRDIQSAYPNAKILYVDNLSPKERDKRLAQIALDDWDLVILPHSLVDRLELKAETVEKMVRDEIERLDALAREVMAEDQSGFAGSLPEDMDLMDADLLRDVKNRTAKELVKERMRLHARIVRASQLANQADTVFFEDMGVDMMMVDEAHIFKKLPLSTKQSVKGLNKAGSERGTMMMLLSSYIRQNNKGRGVHLFTGTPITNTMNEVYNLQRLIMEEEMDRDGFKDWDGWFNNFAETNSDVELTTGGEYDSVERLSAFINIPELRQVIGQYLDVVFADDMPEFVLRESREGLSDVPVGRPYKEVVLDVAPMTPVQARWATILRDRYRTFKAAKGREKMQMKYTEFNPVVIEGSGVKNALDHRFMEEDGGEDNPNLKINRLMNNMMALYNEHDKSTQMIFMQTGFSDTVKRTRTAPDGTKTTTTARVFNLAKRIRDRLIEEGVPKDQIAIFPDLSKEARADAAKAMREGKIRFAIGNTETMGTGVNAQDYLIAMHHLDAPWMPGDLEQRNGRGWRQGNKWNTVYEYRYLAEGSHDGRRWQILLKKKRFIDAFMRNKNVGRRMEMEANDLDEEGGSDQFEETFSAATGDPRVLVKAKLTKDVDKLERAWSRHGRNLQDTLRRARDAQKEIISIQKRIEGMRLDVAELENNKPESFEMEVLGRKYTDRKEAKQALGYASDRYTDPHGRQEIGAFRGMKLMIVNKQLMIEGHGSYVARPTADSIEAVLRLLPAKVATEQNEIAEKERFIKQSEELVKRPFPGADELQNKRKKLADLEAEMAANPDPSPGWLRTGAPLGTNVYDENGKEWLVVGHRGKDKILVEAGEGEAPVPLDYQEARDEYGTPLFREKVNEDGGNGDNPSPAASVPGGRRLGQASSNVRQTTSNTPRQPGDERDQISAHDILVTAERVFGVPLRKDGFRNPKRAAGIYNWLTYQNSVDSPEVIRVRRKYVASLAVGFHEIAHHIDDKTEIAVGLPAYLDNEIRGLDYKPGGNRVFEGWAEFLRLYMTEPDVDVNGVMMPVAQARAPQFYDWFTKDWMPANKEWAAKIEQFRKYARQYADQSLFAQLRTLIGNNPGDDLEFKERWKRDMRKTSSRIFRAMVNRFSPLQAIQDKLQAKGYQGMLPHDVAMAYDMTSVPNAVMAFEEGVHSIRTGEKMKGAKSLWSIREHLQNDGEYDEAITYAHARHTLHMEQVKPGYNTNMRPEKAQEWVNYVQQDPSKAKRYEAFASELSKFNDHLLDMLVDAGALPPADRDAMQRMYSGDNYFPLHRATDDGKGLFAGARGMVNLPSPVKGRSRQGSDEKIIDPFDATIQRAIYFYGRAAKARVIESLVRAVDPQAGGVGGMGGLMTRVDPKRIVHQGNVLEILNSLVKEGFVPPDEAMAFSTAYEILNGMGVSDARLQVFANRHGINWQDVRAMRYAAQTEPDLLSVISLWRDDYTPDGKRRIVRVTDAQGNPQMYELDEDLHATLTGMDELTSNVFFQVLRQGAKYFKEGAVGLSTGFGTANLIRDYISYQGRAENASAAQALGKPIEMLARYAAHKALNLAGSNSDSALIRLFEEMGGSLYSRVGHDIASRTRVRKRKLGGKVGAVGAVKDTANAALESLQDVIAMSDAPPRLAAMQLAVRKAGYEAKGDKWSHIATGALVSSLPEDVRIRAANAAAEATVNFKRTGWAGRYIEAFTPFFNAALQSQYRQAKLIKNLKHIGQKGDKGAVARKYLAMLSSVIAYSVVHWLMRGDDDDYREGEAWLRDGYWTWGKDGKTYVRIPKPREEAIAGNVVEAILDSYYHTDRGSVSENVMGVAWRDLLGRTPTGGGVLRGGIEAFVADYDYFRGRDLTPEGLKDKPKALQYTDTTLGASKYLSEHVGQYLGMSPIQVEHMLTSASGGAYKRWLETAEAVRHGEVTMDRLPENLPFVRGLAMNRHQARSMNDFYEQHQAVTHQVMLAEAKGEVPAEVAKEKALLDDYYALMTKVRNMEPKTLRGRKSFLYQPYLVGLARDALGYEELENNPNPLYASDLPPELHAAMVKHSLSKAESVVLSHNSPLKAAQGLTYEETVSQFKENRKADEEWLRKHRSSPIVKEALQQVKSGKSYRDLVTLKGQPNYTLGKDWEEYRNLRSRWFDKVAQAKRWVGDPE